MKILHIIDSLGLGGAEKLLVNTVNNLPQFTHHIIALSDKKDLADDLAPEVSYLSLSFSSKIQIPKIVFVIRNYIKDNNIAIVHSHLVLSTMIARLAVPDHIKLFSTLHSLVGTRFFGKGKRFNKYFEKKLYKANHTIIAVSEDVLNDYDKNIGLKGSAFILPNFVEDKFFVQTPKYIKNIDQLKLLAVGSLKPPKNYDYLIKAFAQLPSNVFLDIYGEGPLKEQLANSITQEKRIRLCGNVKGIEGIFHQYDLFVMSSLYEGHPIALLEAMASGMPTIVSDIPVLRNASGGKGLFFSLSDFSTFVDMINNILQQKIDLNIFAQHNLIYAKQVARKDIFLQQLITIYQTGHK